MSLSAFSILLLICCFTFQGCAFHQAYPDRWASIEGEHNRECPDLKGFFINKGEFAETAPGYEKYPPYLYPILFKNVGEKTNDIDTIGFYQRDQNLVISAYEKGEVIEQRTIEYDRNKQSCRKGMLKIKVPKPEGGINREGVLGYSWEGLGLTINKEGSLIVRSSEGGIGIMLMIPVIGVSSGYARFQSTNIVSDSGVTAEGSPN